MGSPELIRPASPARHIFLKGSSGSAVALSLTHLAGGYEQLRYYLFNGSPGPSNDRGVRVSIEKIAAA